MLADSKVNAAESFLPFPLEKVQFKHTLKHYTQHKVKTTIAKKKKSQSNKTKEPQPTRNLIKKHPVMVTIAGPLNMEHNQEPNSSGHQNIAAPLTG